MLGKGRLSDLLTSNPHFLSNKHSSQETRLLIQPGLQLWKPKQLQRLFLNTLKSIILPLLFLQFQFCPTSASLKGRSIFDMNQWLITRQTGQTPLSVTESDLKSESSVNGSWVFYLGKNKNSYQKHHRRLLQSYHSMRGI